VGDVWAALFMIGLLILPLVLLGSVAYVIAVAARIAALTGRRDTVWKIALLHVVLVAGFGVGLEMAAERYSNSVPLVSLATFVRAASILVVPLVLHRRLAMLRSTPRGADVPPATASDVHFDDGEAIAPTSREPSQVTREQRTTANRIAWTIAVTGTLTPWLVGLGVKAYLQSQGQPTLPVATFLDPVALPVVVVATLTMWSFPFVLLALAARYLILGRDHPARSFRQRLRLAWLAFAGGMVGAVLLFVPVFWKFDIIYVIIPIGLYYLPIMGLGYGLGALMIRRGWIRA
jgi:hypothetical protein